MSNDLSRRPKLDIKDFFSALAHACRSKALIFGTASSAFEWYDYALFGYFATLIGTKFFPTHDTYTALLASFAVFASGFLMRPLGAVFFGYIGDRFGRNRALSLSLILMAFPTTALGLLPTYDSIGLLASVGLVLVRLFQGLAVGGNYGGSFIFTIEHAPIGRKGMAGSLAMFGTLGGLFLGSGVAAAMGIIFSEQTLSDYAWRFPFLVGGLSAVLAFYIRKHIPEYLEGKEELSEQAPLTIVVQKHVGPLFKAMALVLIDGVGVYVLFVFMTTFAQVFLQLPQSGVLLINTFSMASLVVTIPFFGWLGDQVGQKKILITVSLGFMLLSLPLYFWLISAPTLFALALVQSIFAVIIGAAYGALPAAVVGSFPHHIRYTACSIAFNVSVAVFGGTAPLVATKLIQVTGSLLVPAVMLTVVGGVSLVAALRLHRSYL